MKHLNQKYIVNDDTMTTIEKLSGIVKSFNFDTMKKIEKRVV